MSLGDQIIGMWKRWAGVDVPRDHVAGWKASRRFWRRPAIACIRFRERAAVPELSWTIPLSEVPRHQTKRPIIIAFNM